MERTPQTPRTDPLRQARAPNQKTLSRHSSEGLAGIHTLSVTAVNHDGAVAHESVQVLVYADEGATEAPARGVLSSDSGWDGIHDGDFTISMNLWHGVNGSVFRLYEDGELIATKLLTADSPNAQIATVDVTGKQNGTYVYTGELINAAGVTSTTTKVKVKDAAPAKVVLSHDNHDKDGNYTLTSNLWWGTNGTHYELYEDGELIDEQTLVAATPNAQTASTYIAAQEPGTYRYVSVFTNPAGESTSKEVKVTVR